MHNRFQKNPPRAIGLCAGFREPKININTTYITGIRMFAHTLQNKLVLNLLYFQCRYMLEKSTHMRALFTVLQKLPHMIKEFIERICRVARFRSWFFFWPIWPGPGLFSASRSGFRYPPKKFTTFDPIFDKLFEK